MSAAPVRITVGVVVERHKAKSPWIDFTWMPVSVLPGLPEASPWTVLSESDECATYYAGVAEIELYRTETGNYRSNLTAAAPVLWIALRPTQAGEALAGGIEPPYEIATITADPAEGEALTEAGTDVVDVVPMPEPVRAQIEAFVAEHHVERPFYKRQRDRADPEALARGGPTRKERE
jgi:Protein of unknown function (DUF3305)